MPVLNEYVIIGCTFLLLHQEYNHRVWVCIVTIIDDHEIKVSQDPGYINLICSIDDNRYAEIVSCYNINNNIVHQEDKKIVLKLKRITSHEEPLN